MSIRVMIADDHALVREGIKAVLEKTTSGIKVVAEAADGQELLKIAGYLKADIYLVDITMPQMNGIELTESLIRKDPLSKIIIISMHDDRQSVERALKCGARGYLIKESASDEVVKAIHELLLGKIFLSARVRGFLVDDYGGSRHDYGRDDKFEHLTPKERAVLQLIAESHSSKEVAVKLNMAVATVQAHRKNIMRKLGAHKQSELVRFAIKEGIARL